MINESQNIHPKRWSGARIVLLVGGAVGTLMAIAAMGLGGVALWGDAQKDDRGYLSTDSERFTAGTHALATENLDVDLDGAETLVDSTALGDTRVDVTPAGDNAVFVGVARTDAVDSYLRGVAHTTVTDLDSDPFEASYSPHEGDARPAAPAKQDIWTASTQGAGRQTLNWEVEDGDWSVVVMNADGSRGVDADVSAGAKVPILDEIGWTAIGVGGVMLIVSVGLIVVASLPRNPSGPKPKTGLAPAAG